MAINKVVYGDDTLIDLTSDTVTSATMLNGTTAHDKSGTVITGNYVPPATPTSITPSNASPVALTADAPVNPTANGYAIASYSSVTPSNTGDLVSSGDIVKFGGSGVVVDDIAGITPSNANPVQLDTGSYYGMGDDGYAIASYTPITPASVPVSVSSGDIIKINGSGEIIDEVPIATSITPDNANPPTLEQDGLYFSTGNGKAVASLTSITPSNRSPVALTSGDIDKMGGNGYAIASYNQLSSTLSNRVSEYLYSGNSFYRTQYGSGSGYFYNTKPTGRILFSVTTTPARSNTSWSDVNLQTTAYDTDGTSISTVLDDNFGHIDTSTGTIVVDRAISTAYLAGQAYMGQTSSGTKVYSGLRFLKNGTVIDGTSVTGSSSTTQPSFRRITTSFAIGDVIKIQVKVTSTTQAYCRVVCNIQTP